MGVFPEGLVLSWDCPNNTYILFHCVMCLGKSFVNSTDTLISLSHTVHNREIWGICKGYVGGCYTGLCPRYGGLFH